MNPLESRKKLLVAESELNREQLVQDCQTMADEARSLADQARTVSSVVSAAASVVASIASFRCKKSAPASKKSSWLQTILKGAQWAASLWLEFRARPKS